MSARQLKKNLPGFLAVAAAEETAAVAAASVPADVKAAAATVASNPEFLIFQRADDFPCVFFF